MYKNKIFREYDIRGVVYEDYDEDFARKLGRAFARMLKDHGGSKASLGRDCRLSSPDLSKAVMQGMTESGIEVWDIGVVTTPMVYFSLFNLEVDGGIQVSGSHNPPDQNGFKISVGKETLYGSDIQKLREIIEQEDFPKGEGKVLDKPVRDMYIKWVSENIKLEKPLKVVIDGGNGTAGPVAAPILKNLGCEVHELYTDMDGRFPNHHPDPTVEENVQELIATVRKTGAQVGIGYDGDGDRIGVVDDEGRIVWGDMLLMLLARAVLEEVPGATIVGEVKCSHLLFDDIEKHGGRAIMWKAGHSLIKAKLKQENGALGGEMSGHIFYKHRFFGFDDAVYAGCRLLELLSRWDRKLSDMMKEVPKTYNTPELRIESSDERKFDIVKEASEHFKSQGYETIDVDGVRLVFPDGWGLVRASNTQPMLVMRFEAESEGRLNEIRDLVEKKINELNK
ncbi:MAG: phosphomannomutase/phosphoglucomutase [bacterium]